MPEQPENLANRNQRVREKILKARPQHVSKQPDQKYAAEKQDLEHAQLREKVRALEQDTSERKRYAALTFRLLVCWLTFIAGVLLLEGFAVHGFKLGQVNIVALIGGTTAGVLGLLTIVTRYLFPASPKK